MQEVKSKILIVDDESQIRKMLNIFLDASDYKIEESDCGKQAVRMANSVRPDLILLDLDLPDMDGKEVIKQIREWSQVPIIVLSVRVMDDEVIAALNMGANDYMTKPFNSDVLIARIKANLRKAVIQEAGETELVNGSLRMDLMRHEVYLDEAKIELTPKEYKLVRFFMINRGRMLTHKQILSDVWGAAHGEDTQYLRVYVGQIREKLELEPSNPTLIVTEPGVGYRMEMVQPARWRRPPDLLEVQQFMPAHRQLCAGFLLERAPIASLYLVLQFGWYLNSIEPNIELQVTTGVCTMTNRKIVPAVLALAYWPLPHVVPASAMVHRPRATRRVSYRPAAAQAQLLRQPLQRINLHWLSAAALTWAITWPENITPSPDTGNPAS